MNNLKSNNMKKTIFEGTVNGEKFSNVNDYNARVKELMESGKFESASSSTRVEEYETSGLNRVCDDQSCTTCTEVPTFSKNVSTTADYDSELSLYPFLDEDDDFLDRMLSSNTEINKETLKEIDRVFGKCYTYIVDMLEDKDFDLEDKEEYLDDVNDIIETIIDQKNDTLESISTLNKKHNDLSKEFDRRFKELDDEYNRETKKIDDKIFILKESKLFIDKFLDFYRNIQSEGILMKKSYSDKKKSCGKCKCGGHSGECECDNKCEKETVTTFTEKTPQREESLMSLFNKIFGPEFVK